MPLQKVSDGILQAAQLPNATAPQHVRHPRHVLSTIAWAGAPKCVTHVHVFDESHTSGGGCALLQGPGGVWCGMVNVLIRHLLWLTQPKCVAPALLLLLLAPGPAVLPNLVRNPGMEEGINEMSANQGAITGVVPNWWVDNSDWASPSPVLSYFLTFEAPRTAASGRSLCVQVTSGFAQFGQSVALHLLSNVTAQAYVRVKAAPTTTTPVSVTLILSQASSPYGWLVSKQLSITKTSGWVLFNIPGLPQLTQANPLDTPGVCAVLFLLYVGTPGATVCVDDARLSELGKQSRWL